MPSAPTISIGMPVYNAAEYLPGALDALLAQTCGDFELLISDNASTDATREIALDYAAGDRRIAYHRLPENIGSAGNFNHVFTLARGEFFKWAAYDDLCAPTMLERCLDVLGRDRSALWCHTRSSHIGPDGELLGDRQLLDVSYSLPDAAAGGYCRSSLHAHQRLAGVLLARGGCLDSYGLIRSEAMRRTQLILPYYGSEKVFIAELAMRGHYREVPETLFFVRVHGKGSGAQPTAAAQQQFINPRAKGRQLTRLHLLRGYLAGIARAELPRAEKARCLVVVMRYLLQVHKWGDVLTRALRGRGVGGGNIERLQQSRESKVESREPIVQGRR